MSSPIETLKKWAHHLLFRFLPARVFLRLHGIKLPHRKIMVTVTHLFDGKEIEMKVTLGDVSAIAIIIPFWLKTGMIHNYQGQRRRFRPDKLIKVAWFDPILNGEITIYNPFRDQEYIDYVLSN